MTKTVTVPAGTMATALVAAGVPTSNYMFFDLLEHVEDKLELSNELKSQVLGTLAWAMDSRIVNLGRDIFFKNRATFIEANGVDAFNEYLSKMDQLKAVGDHQFEIGYSQNDSWTTLTMLMNMRQHWHDRAQLASTRVNYEPKSLRSLILDEQMQQVSPREREMYAVRAQFAAPDDEAMQKEVVGMLVKQAEEEYRSRHALRQKTAPAILRIIELAANASAVLYDGDCLDFHLLPISMQLLLIDSASTALNLGLNRLAKIRSMSVDDYTVAIRDARALDASLKLVKAAPKFDREARAIWETQERREHAAASQPDAG